MIYQIYHKHGSLSIWFLFFKADFWNLLCCILGLNCCQIFIHILLEQLSFDLWSGTIPQNKICVWMFIYYLSKLFISNMKIFRCFLYRKNILSPYGDFCFYLIIINCCIFYKLSPRCFLIEPVYILNINCFSFFPIETRMVYFSFFKPVFGAFINSEFCPRNNHGEFIPPHFI